MRYMKTAPFWILALFALVSCAGIGIFGNAQSEFEAGLGFFNRGEYREAIPHFEKATSIDPNFAQAYIYLGRSYLNLHEYGKALPPLRAAYGLAPEAVEKEIFNLIIDALLGVVGVGAQGGDFRGSMDLLEDALKGDPKSMELLRLLRELKGK